jgi:hypothetical protein
VRLLLELAGDDIDLLVAELTSRFRMRQGTRFIGKAAERARLKDLDALDRIILAVRTGRHRYEQALGGGRPAGDDLLDPLATDASPLGDLTIRIAGVGRLQDDRVAHLTLVFVTLPEA